MKIPKIIVLNNWEEEFLNLINKKIFFSKKKKINIMLTGGNTIKKFYTYWSKNFKNFGKKIDIFISDERNVPPFDKNNNGFMVEKYLVSKVISKNLTFHKYNTKSYNSSKICNDYSKKLVDNIDILILSLGVGGHVASIFNDNYKLLSKKKLIEFTYIKSIKEYRYTITPRVIDKSNSVFILCIGQKKGNIFKTSLRSKKSIINSIKKISNDSNWILDCKAKKSFYEK